MSVGVAFPSSGLPSRLRLEDVLPVSEPVSKRLTPLFLEWGEKERYGPFELVDAQTIRLGSTLFDIRTENRDSFFLVRRADGWAQGPFPTADGATIRLADAELRVRRPPASIVGQLRLEGVAVTRLPVALVRMDDETPRRLARLRIEFWKMEEELAVRTAPRRLDAPVIRDSSGKTLFSPIIDRSEADRARAWATAQRRAREHMETFLRESGARTVVCEAPHGQFAFADLLPGRYFVCLTAEARDPESGRIPRFEPRFWWADITLDLYEVAEVTFRGAGRSWFDLYP